MKTKKKKKTLVKVKKKNVAVKKKKVVKRVPVASKKAAKMGPMKPILDRIKHAVTTKYGAESILSLGDDAREVPVAFDTGIPELNECIGIPGYPEGRIIEVFGPESSGKTTLALHAIAECQKAGGTATFVDAEHALDVTYAEKVGVDLDKVLISQPDSGEMGLSIVETTLKAITETPPKDRKPSVIVVDSVAALTPRSEIEGEVDKHKGTAEQARMMSRALRKLCVTVHKSGAVLIFINQTRDRINFSFGGGKTTTGGNALKFYATIRINIKGIGKEEAGGQRIGTKTEVTVVKNKIAPPFKSFVSLIRFGVGFDLNDGRYKKLLKLDDVEQAGSWISLPDERKIQGYNGFLEFIKDDDDDNYIARLIGEITDPEDDIDVEADSNEAL